MSLIEKTTYELAVYEAYSKRLAAIGSCLQGLPNVTVGVTEVRVKEHLTEELDSTLEELEESR